MKTISRLPQSILAFGLLAAAQAYGQAYISSLVRSSDGGGYFVRVTAPNCTYIDSNGTGDAGANQYFWWKNGVQQPALNGQSKIYVSAGDYSSATYTVYVYPNASFVGNQNLSYATTVYSGPTTIYNLAPKVLSGANFVAQTGANNINRCMLAVCITGNPIITWYKKVSGSFTDITTEANDDGNGVMWHLGQFDCKGKEFKAVVSNTSGKSNYVLFKPVDYGQSGSTGDVTISNANDY